MSHAPSMLTLCSGCPKRGGRLFCCMHSAPPYAPSVHTFTGPLGRQVLNRNLSRRPRIYRHPLVYSTRHTHPRP